MPSNSATVLPPLGTGRRAATPQQRAKTAHTASSLPLAGTARVSTHPLLPPHHMMRRGAHHRRHQHQHQLYSPQTHRRHVSHDPAAASCSLVTDHIVGLRDAPELPEIEELLKQGAANRATIIEMIEQGICRTSFSDVQRFPAIHPSIMSARMDRIVRYITFVSAPPIEHRAPKDRPKSWDRKAYKPLGPDECFRCQLQTDHAVCERHKYLRVGGGFRHSYWYIKQTMDIIEVEHRKVVEEVQKRYLVELAKKARKAQTRRQIKTYIRGADGKLVSRLCFVTEEEYQEMKKDDTVAKKILGLAEDEELDDWVSSRQKYVVDEKGEIVKVSRQKIRHSAYEESIESADVNNNYYGKEGRRRGRKGRHHRRHSDSDSFESGMGNSILEEGEGGRRGRRRHGRRGRHGSGDRSSSVESVESYVSAGGTRRERRVRRRRRRRSWDGSESSYSEDEDGKHHRRRRRHRRRRSYSGSDSGTGFDSDDSRQRGRGGRRRGGGRRGHRRHRGRHRGDYSDDDGSSDDGSYDSRDGGGRGRRRGGRRGRRRYSSYSDDSQDSRRSGKRNRKGGRRHRRRYSSYSDESDSVEGGKDGHRKRRGRHHRSRRHRGHSSSDSSDYSDSDDSRRRGRRHHRRHRRRRHGSDDDFSGSDSGSPREGADGKKGRRRGRRHHRRRYSDDSMSSQDGDDYEGGGGARGGRRRRRRHRRSDSYSDSYSDSDGGSGDGEGRGRRRRRRRHHSSDSDGSYDSDDYDRRRGGRRKGGRRGGGKHGRRRHRGKGSYSDDDDSFDSDGSSFGSDSDGSHRRRRRHGRRAKGKGRGRRGRARRGSDGRSLSDDDDSYSAGSGSSSSYDSSSSSESLPESSEVSDASDPSSVHSSDLSDIDSTLDEEERRRIKAVKKARKMEEKRSIKQQLKVEVRKEAREVKREKIKKEKEERKQERRKERRERKEERKERGRGRRRNERDRRRRHRTPTSRSVSECSSVSSVYSDDISDVGSQLAGEERQRAVEAKKAKKKAQKKEMKQKEKVMKIKEEHREKRKEKERKRIKREIEREMDRMSSPSDVSSVHSSDLSSSSDQEDEGLTTEEKIRRKQERKQKKKEEKKREKKLFKAVQKVMAKRQHRRGSGSSDDSYARGKQDFYDLPPEVRKTMVKYAKGSKRGLVDGDDGLEWLDDWKNKKEKEKRKKNKKGKGEFTGETVELKAPDGRVIRVPKTSMYDVWKAARKIRLKKDGTVARDSDSDAESIELDAEGNMLTQPKTVELTSADRTVRWEGFAPEPEPPLTPTQGGKIKFQGVRKVHHAFRKDNGVLTEHLKKVLDTASELNDPRAGERAEVARGSYERRAWESVDFITHFRLVETSKLDPLGRAFVVEDEDYDCSLTAQEMRFAIEGVPSLSSIKPKQLDYVLKVLNIDDHTTVSFKMFAVVAGVCERMCNMDSFGKYILDKTDLLDIARKMALYKSIFYCNVNSERSDNHITAESLRIELIAGGLNREQERYIMSKMNPNEYGEISFFDYMAYIPLFLSMHENIIDNPLDRQEKYTRLNRAEMQRDMNPLGLPLQRTYAGVPREIFPFGIPSWAAGEGGAAAVAATPRTNFIEKAEQLDGGTVVVPGQSARFPSISQKVSSPLSAKKRNTMKNTTVSLP